MLSSAATVENQYDPLQSAAMLKTTCSVLITSLLACALGCAAPDPNRTLPKIPRPQIPKNEFKITDYGAVGDGKTSNTKAFADAIKACQTAKGGKVIVPSGTFLTGPIKLVSNMELYLSNGATMLFSDHFDDYPSGAVASLPERHQSLISIEGGHDIAITGNGRIDGQGAKWWDDFRAHRHDPGFVERRPKMIVFYQCKRVRIEDVTLTNSPMFHMSPTQTEDVWCENVKVVAPKNSPNTDSFNPSGWNIVVTKCQFDTGDDNIAVKPFVKLGDGRLSVENLYIAHCVFKHGHGLSVGGQTPGGLRNMHVWDIDFEDTDIGIRLKAERGQGGLVENVTYDDIRMKNVATPIMITSYYHGLPKVGEKHEIKPMNDRTPIWRHIEIKNLVATGAKDAGLLMGLPEMTLENITLENVQIDAEKPLRIGYARGLVFKHVSIRVPDGKPLLIEENVQGTGLSDK
jgi:polygalacturonase